MREKLPNGAACRRLAAVGFEKATLAVTKAHANWNADSDRAIGWNIFLSEGAGQSVNLLGFPKKLEEIWLRERGESPAIERADLQVEYGKHIHVRPDEKYSEDPSKDICRFDAIHVYGLIPPGNPRLVLPLKNRAQLLRGLAMHKPGRASARMIMLVLRCLAAIGITSPFARQKLIVHRGTPANGDVDPDSILYLGTEDPDRKTTILSPKPDEISKYGRGELAQAALLQEADMLTALRDTVVASQVPRLLSFGSMGNGQLLRQEYRAPIRATQNWLEAEAARFLTKLSEVNSETRDGIPGHLCHGDLAPWNMIRSQSGLFVFDWEKGRDWAPALTDAFYFILAPALHVRRRDQLAEAASKALRFGRQVAHATKVDEDMIPILWQLWANSESNFSSRETFERVRNLKVPSGE